MEAQVNGTSEGHKALDRDFSKPLDFDLGVRRPNKTVDIGTNGTSVSADPLGLILQLSGFHPEHGVIVAAPYEQFDGSKFREPLCVRAYRRRMLDMIQARQPGFGLRLGGDDVREVAILHKACNTALFQYQLDDDASVSYTLQVLDNGEVIQTAELSNTSNVSKSIPFSLNLGLSVHRASYGQLTEGGPIPLPKSENVFAVAEDGRHFRVSNRNLEAHLQGSVAVNGEVVELANLPSETRHNSPVSVTVMRSVEVGGASSCVLTARFRLVQMASPADTFSSLPPKALSLSPCAQQWKDLHSIETYIIRRNIDYILGNCTFPISDVDVAIITDHVALPLGWNRDNYWQMRLLLKAKSSVDKLLEAGAAEVYKSVIHRTTKGHLHWVFNKAQRPHGFWHRSYLVTGRPKDGPVFQLDQQCYPFLELCDFYEQYPDELPFIRGLLCGGSASQVLNLIMSHRDPKTGLLTTDETPGDDAVEYPYHFSSHVLLWHTLSRLSQLLLAARPDSFTDPADLQSFAADIRAATLAHFLIPSHPSTGLPTLAYLTDGAGHYTVYHDANDIPTLFATQWGFLVIAAEVEAWSNTMMFALSPANSTGYCAAGQFHGLGSVHSAGPWPLGYFQEWVYAGMVGDEAAEADAWRRIADAMLWDGTFCEAVDAETAECSSKNWFSWPGAMIAAELAERRR